VIEIEPKRVIDKCVPFTAALAHQVVDTGRVADVDLPVMPPVAPMLAKPAKTMPIDMHYEGKWDGFRAIIFRDRDEVIIGSRTEKPLTRYFPEIVEIALAGLPERCVVDGEIIIVTDGHLDFDALLQRIHPAESRVETLSQQTPAEFVAFDLLAIDDRDLMTERFELRREQLVQRVTSRRDGLHLAPATDDISIARRWFTDFEGAGLDGIIAKSRGGRYEPNKRTMIKIKHERTADCVVAGFRWHKSGGVVGSLLLGLYNNADVLQQVGISAAFTMSKRAELVELLDPLRIDPATGHVEHPWLNREQMTDSQRVPGTQSRWNAGKDLSWVPIRPELVAEVAYDHMQGDRFRHTARFRHWRPDRDPRSCTYGQLEIPATSTIQDVFE
jgi:ATP-dependent DNA ligase